LPCDLTGVIGFAETTSNRSSAAKSDNGEGGRKESILEEAFENEVDDEPSEGLPFAEASTPGDEPSEEPCKEEPFPAPLRPQENITAAKSEATAIKVKPLISFEHSSYQISPALLRQRRLRRNGAIIVNCQLSIVN